MKNLLILILLVAAFANRDVEAKKKHPGCLIWWFLPGCPLGKIFGTDPFGIYPWDKFCSQYEAFDDTEFCKDKEEE